MTVRIVTDSSACLPAALAERCGITVLPLHQMSKGGKTTTAGLGALELAAAFGREVERSGDDGVVAIHLSKEMSSTWSSAVTAAGVFPDDAIRVLDTSAVGMGLGAAAIAAARTAQKGGDLSACTRKAMHVLEHSTLYLAVHRLDELRKSGRLSAAASLVSTALATRPIIQVVEGKLSVAAKARTQAKALTKLVELITDRAAGAPVTVIIQQHEAREAARRLERGCLDTLPEHSGVLTVDLSQVLAVHSGPGAVAVTVLDAEATTIDGEPLLAGAEGFTRVGDGNETSSD